MSKNYGIMVSFAEAVKWIERDLPDSSMRDRVMARLRYERDKAVPVAPKQDKGRRWTTYNCGNCGRGILETHWKYCPNCGFAIKRDQMDGYRNSAKGGRTDDN